MAQLKNPAFTFQCSALDKYTFDVIRFTGQDALSSVYSFDLLLLSDKDDIDAAKVLQGTGTFGIHPPFAPKGEMLFNGIISSFSQLHRIHERYVYRACLRHPLWWLTLSRHSQIFLDKTPADIIQQILRDGGLTQDTDFAWQCQQSYPAREFACQYDESDFNYISRWMERLGVYYWFDHTPTGTKLILADSRMTHAALPDNAQCQFVEPSGLNPENPGQVITAFSLTQRPLPKEVQLKTYNPEKPDLDLTCTAPVQDKGRGTFYHYGDNFSNKDEGNALAKVQADILLCQEAVYSGYSHNPALRPGYTFTLSRHFRSAWNRGYLTTAVEHEGSQARMLMRAYSMSRLEDDGLYYRNTFHCIPDNVQFRAPRQTPWPRVSGSVVAHVDAEGSGMYAELDSQGRYKVNMPFDLSGRKGGKASCWLRMMQPYAGEGMGFHAPLHKGTEVMISFVDGDADRPIIAAAVPNPQTPSPVNDASASQIRLTSGGGNKIHIEDSAGQEHILLSSPSGNSFIRIGKF